MMQTFVFQNVFDEKGVLFHIATKGTTQLYRNPHEAGYVVASRSSDGMFGGGDVKSFVGRTSEVILIVIDSVCTDFFMLLK